MRPVVSPEEEPFVSVEEAMAVAGLTMRQLRYDVANGYLPGEIDRRKRIVIRRGPWNEWLAGTWTPAEPEAAEPATESQPVSFLHRLPA